MIKIPKQDCPNSELHEVHTWIMRYGDGALENAKRYLGNFCRTCKKHFDSEYNPLDKATMEKETMKSAQSRAAEVCRKLGLPVDETENGVAYQVILKALQDYGQDIRIACAKAVKGIPDPRISHATINYACMNAKVE